MLKTIRSWLRLHSARRAACEGRRAVEGLDDEALSRMARDVGVSVRELQTVIGNAAGSTDRSAERPCFGLPSRR